MWVVSLSPASLGLESECNIGALLLPFLISVQERSLGQVSAGGAIKCEGNLFGSASSGRFTDSLP